jgi:putative ABC transport system substrate-binding protein
MVIASHWDATAVGDGVIRSQATTASELEGAFAMLVGEGIGAVIISQVVALAAHHALPAMYPFPGIAENGGLISYGGRGVDAVRLAGTYVGRILKGEKPADLPVQAPTKYETVLNLKTAKALGLNVPQTLLVAADEVIE